MNDLKNETAKLIVGSTQNLAQVVASASFDFFQRKDLRLYVDFDNLSQTEQDRIFNELELSVLGLFVLYFDYEVNQASLEEKKIVFSSLRKDLPAAFLQMFIELGIEKKFIDQWKMLIEMRLKEYRGHFGLAMKESSKWKEFKEEKLSQSAWAQIETIAIDCLTHIRRGKVEKDDPLWKLLRKWLITLYAQISPMSKL